MFFFLNGWFIFALFKWALERALVCPRLTWYVKSIAVHGASPARVIVCSRLHPLKRLSHYSSIWSHQPFEFLLGEAHVIVCRVVVVVQVGVKDERVIRIQGVVCLVLPESAQGQECNVNQDEPCWLSVLHVQREKKTAYVMTGCLVKSGSQAPVSLLEIGQTCKQTDVSDAVQTSRNAVLYTW